MKFVDNRTNDTLESHTWEYTVVIMFPSHRIAADPIKIKNA